MPAKQKNKAIKSSKAKRPRVRILDSLRGLALVSMAIWHAIFDLVYIFDMSIPWFHQLPTFLWAQITCWCFIFISGGCVNYGRQTLRRALLVFGCGLAITFITYVAMPSMLITWGILHLLGCCMLLAALLKPLFERIPWGAGCVVCALLFVLLYSVSSGFVGFLGFPFAELPRELYRTDFLFPLGFPGPTFYSGDYFPLIPWVFLFFAGFFAFRFLKGRAFLKATTPGKNPLEWMGRHSLIIYLLHQPVIYGLLWLLQFAGLLS